MGNFMTLIEFVNTHLRKSHGNFRPEPKIAWWTKNNAMQHRDEIYNATSFLENPVWPQRMFHITNEINHPMQCANPGCNSCVKWSTQVSKYNLYCSKGCAKSSPLTKEKFANTCLERYGVSAPVLNAEIKKKQSDTCLERYGVANSGSSPLIKQKMREAIRAKYGIDNVMLLPEIKERHRQTSIAKYGVPYAMQNQTVLDKRTATNIERYGVASPTQVPEIRAKQVASLQAHYGVTNTSYRGIDPATVEILLDKDKFSQLITGKFMYQVVEESKLDITTLYNYVKKYEVGHLMPKNYGRSSHETQMEEFLTANGIRFESSNRTILKPKELDIFLPDHNIAIELCGVYWHSDKFSKKDDHYYKWKRCKELGITLLTYFDDELATSLDVIKSKILYLTKRGNYTRVGARQLVIKPVTIEQEREFFEKNHIQGFLKNRSQTVGAYLDDKLIAAMCFSKRGDYQEITRYAVDIGYNAPGAFSKLLQHFVRSNNYSGSIVSFSDNCHSTGALYRTAGFAVVNEQGPSYSYTFGGSPRLNRQGFTKSKIKSKFNIEVDDRTEDDLMKELGYSKVWDCGKIKWELIIPRK